MELTKEEATKDSKSHQSKRIQRQALVQILPSPTPPLHFGRGENGANSLSFADISALSRHGWQWLLDTHDRWREDHYGRSHQRAGIKSVGHGRMASGFLGNEHVVWTVIKENSWLSDRCLENTGKFGAMVFEEG